ncbi:MAG: metallophosphoesterase [Oscillospiraceae bacterium]|nr:metallophosphoesterase [Oscillospiraceae bacterium]
MRIKRFTALTICITLIISLLLSSCTAALNQTDATTTLIACSDFQHPDGNEPGQEILESFVQTLNANDITSADGLFFCGDYAHHTYGVTEETVEGIKAIKESFSPLVTQNMVFVQGNHDASLGTEGLSPSGDNDPENDEYGVFVLHNSDYMWHNDNEATIKRTAQRLIEYLNEKIVIAYDKPIFILSHLPLNYSMRTYHDGDAMHANYIFNVLNEAGAKGLNIFYLFGHDHSNGWDDYLGGSTVYLAKGDEILIAQNSRTEFKTETLNFTYLNPGYIGYYTNVNGADDTLTVSVFTITDGTVTVSRYSREGIHNLKTQGVRNNYQGEKAYEPNTTVYSSPQTVQLTKVTDSSLIKNLINEPTEGEGGKYIRVTNPSKLKDGARCLLIYNANLFMLPKVVTKENSNGVKRIGFAIEKAADFGTDTVYGRYSDKEWVLTKSGDGWLLGNGEGYAKFTSTADSAITATFESAGDTFVIDGSADAFTFACGENVLNYNSRGLINGYAGNPAAFSIYEFAGYTVNVTYGKANKTDALAGETVKLTADKAPNGKVFSKWVVVAGNVVLEDETDTSTSFIMPEGEVRIVASYTDK